ncbi:hypothetical protein [Streptomyces sp. NPDC001348]
MTGRAPGGRAWPATWSRAHDTLAFHRGLGRREPAALPGRETDAVVFPVPA